MDGAAGQGTPTSGRHRCAERSERRVPPGRPDDAEHRGPGREATAPNSGPFSAARLRRAVPTGGQRSPAWASLCAVAWGRDVHHPGTALSCGRGERAAPIMWVSPGGAGTARPPAAGETHTVLRLDYASARGTPFPHTVSPPCYGMISQPPLVQDATGFPEQAPPKKAIFRLSSASSSNQLSPDQLTSSS